jgi:peptide/nickel transport system substrate-binding protein
MILVLPIVAIIIAAGCTASDNPSGQGTSTVASTTEDAVSSTLPADHATTTTPAAATTTTSEPPLQHPYGGNVIVADNQEPETLNPFAPGGDRAIVSSIGQGYYAGVQEVSGYTLEFIPELVTELPTVANGGVVINEDGTMTVSYQIRDEAEWDDGTPISGTDFEFTLGIVLDPDLPIDKTVYQDIDLDSIVVGDKTFEYTLVKPTVSYELIFGTIIPKHAVEGSDFANEWNQTTWPSSGPFKFSEWQKGESITLTRNDNYWKTDQETGQQLPYLDSVTFKFIPEMESLVTAFKAREADIIQIVESPPNIEAIRSLQALEPEGARVEVLPGPDWEHLNFQFGDSRFAMNEASCNENFNMRLAIVQTIDRQAIADEVLSGLGSPLESYVDPFSPSISQQSWSQYTVDPGAAAESFAKAVEETGKDCRVVFTTTRNNAERVAMSELFVDMFAASNIPYENQLQDSSLFFGETLANGQWDLGEWMWSSRPGLSSLIDIHDVFDPEAPPPDGDNYYRWGVAAEGAYADEATARYAEVRDELNATVDETELIELFHEAENILADNLVLIPLYSRIMTAAVWEDEVGNFKYNPSPASHTWNMEFWYRADM